MPAEDYYPEMSDAAGRLKPRRYRTEEQDSPAQKQ